LFALHSCPAIPRCCTPPNLKRRASFSKEDRGLLMDWLAFAERQLSGSIASLQG
jgi:hypothetical protein